MQPLPFRVRVIAQRVIETGSPSTFAVQVIVSDGKIGYGPLAVGKSVRATIQQSSVVQVNEPRSTRTLSVLDPNVELFNGMVHTGVFVKAAVAAPIAIPQLASGV